MLVVLDEDGKSALDTLTLASARKAAIASRSLRLCPSAETPSSLRSSAVRLGRTVSSISFSRNTASYFPRPRLRSQTTTSMMPPSLRFVTHDRPQQRECPGRDLKFCRKVTGQEAY